MLLAALSSCDVLVAVGDAVHDPHFSARPWVTGPGRMRFVAGMPIHLANRERVGTLCIADSTTRTLAASELTTLAALTSTLATMIEGTRALAREKALQLELQRTKTLLERTGSLAEVRGWKVDLTTTRCSFLAKPVVFIRLILRNAVL